MENKENHHSGNTFMHSSSSNMSFQEVRKLSFDFEPQLERKFYINHLAVDQAHKKPALFLKKFGNEEPYFDSVQR